MTARIAGVVNTLNEAGNIRYAVGSLLPWCDDVVVVDQHSADGTADIARGLGARVFSTEPTGYVEAARAFAIDQAQGDWIIVLDADEVVTPGLAREIRRIVDTDPGADILAVPCVNIVFGRWFRSGRWWPGRRMRVFRRSAMRITAEIHRGLQPLPGSQVRRLPARRDAAIWHFSYHSVDDLVEKVNRYTTIEARQASGGDPIGPARIAGDLVRGFWAEYVLGRGYRDGTPGLIWGLIRGFYHMLVTAKRWDEPAIAARLVSQDRLRERILAAHAGTGPGPDEPAPDGGQPRPRRGVSGRRPR